MGSQLSDLSLLVQNPTVPAVAGLSSSWFLQCWFRSLCHILHPAPEPDSPLPVSATGSPGPATLASRSDIWLSSHCPRSVGTKSGCSR